MDTKSWVIEPLKILASIAVPYIALLRTRADLDRFAAGVRAKENGQPIETQMRCRWYHLQLWRRRPKDEDTSGG